MLSNLWRIFTRQPRAEAQLFDTVWFRKYRHWQHARRYLRASQCYKGRWN